jgi:hypothetical protein
MLNLSQLNHPANAPANIDQAAGLKDRNIHTPLKVAAWLTPGNQFIDMFQIVDHRPIATRQLHALLP